MTAALLQTLIAMTVLVNAQRITPVVPDIPLSVRAQARAESLCRTGQWSHTGWLSSFKGLSYKYAGENLARNYPTLQSANAAFMASPTHRFNITRPAYRRLGVGTACGIVVELFTD